MKQLQLVDGNIQTKEIKITAENIPQLIHRMACDFETKWGRQLEAFLIGSNEYTALIQVLRNSSLYASGREVYLYEVDEFMGMKIRLKQSPGIEPEFPKSMWSHIAMGLITEGGEL